MSWRRTAAVLAVALVVALGCSLAGLWQWNRHVDRSAAVALVTTNYDAPPVPLAELVEDGLHPDDVWRPVTVRGAYVGAAVLRNRPVSGTPAAHALGVLEIADGPLAGRLLVVDRGWVPAAEVGGVAAPPTGEVAVVARLRPAEPDAVRDAPTGQVQAIAVEQVLSVAGLDPATAVPHAYGVVETEDGAPPGDVVPVPPPGADLGPHLSYAFQWWVFAVGALAGAVVLLRREASEDDVSRRSGTSDGTAPDGAAVVTPRSGIPGRTSAAAPSGRRPRRRPTAEEEEDAILDAAEKGPGPLSRRS